MTPSIFYTVYTKNANFSCIVDRRSGDSRYSSVSLSVSIMVHHRAGRRAVQGVALWLVLVWQHAHIQFVDIALTQTLSVNLPF